MQKRVEGIIVLLNMVLVQARESRSGGVRSSKTSCQTSRGRCAVADMRGAIELGGTADLAFIRHRSNGWELGKPVAVLR